MGGGDSLTLWSMSLCCRLYFPFSAWCSRLRVRFCMNIAAGCQQWPCVEYTAPTQFVRGGPGCASRSGLICALQRPGSAAVSLLPRIGVMSAPPPPGGPPALSLSHTSRLSDSNGTGGRFGWSPGLPLCLPGDESSGLSAFGGSGCKVSPRGCKIIRYKCCVKQTPGWTWTALPMKDVGTGEEPLSFISFSLTSCPPLSFSFISYPTSIVLLRENEHLSYPQRDSGPT